jgi:hypothetical protein
MSGPDEAEAVADLCRQDDFSWGRPAAATHEATSLTRSAVNSNDGNRPGPVNQLVSAESARVHGAIFLASVEAVFGATDILFEIVPSELGLPPSDERSPHRNSYIAQKRDIVLIV